MNDHPSDSASRPTPELDDRRCAVCGWPLAETVEKGCVRGNCSLRPLPQHLYDRARVNREYGYHFKEPVIIRDGWQERAEELEAKVAASEAREAALQLRLEREVQEFIRQIGLLSAEYHKLLGEPEYAGTRADWILRATKAEADAQQLALANDRLRLSWREDTAAEKLRADTAEAAATTLLAERDDSRADCEFIQIELHRAWDDENVKRHDAEERAEAAEAAIVSLQAQYTELLTQRDYFATTLQTVQEQRDQTVDALSDLQAKVQRTARDMFWYAKAEPSIASDYTIAEWAKTLEEAAK